MDHGGHLHWEYVLVITLDWKTDRLQGDKMNKKRYFLDPPEVKGYLVKGERFTKWSEVSGSKSAGDY